MSDHTHPTDDPREAGTDEQGVEGQHDWPENCPQCGTRLQQVAVDFTAGSAEEVGATADVAGAVFEDRCPNPQCPAHQRTGGAGTGSLGDRQPDQPTTPGSLGGDNGGA